MTAMPTVAGSIAMCAWMPNDASRTASGNSPMRPLMTAAATKMNATNGSTAISGFQALTSSDGTRARYSPSSANVTIAHM